MGRRKLPIEYIKNDKSRRETFKKRMKGLKGKAEQLATLCNAQVGVIVICDEKIHEAGYGSNTSGFRDVIYKYARFNFELNSFHNIQKILDNSPGGCSNNNTNNNNNNNNNNNSSAAAVGGGGAQHGSCLDLNLPGSFFLPPPYNGGPGMVNAEGMPPYNGYIIPASMVNHQHHHHMQMQEDDSRSNSSIGDQKSMVSSVDRKVADSNESKHLVDNKSKVFHQNNNKPFVLNHHHHHGNANGNVVNQCCNLDVEPISSHYPATGEVFHHGDGGGGEFGMFGGAAATTTTTTTGQDKSLVAMSSNTFTTFNSFNGDNNANGNVAFVDDPSRGMNIFPYDPAFQFNHLESALDMDFEKSLPMQSFHWADEPINSNNNSPTPTTSSTC